MDMMTGASLAIRGAFDGDKVEFDLERLLATAIGPDPSRPLGLLLVQSRRKILTP